MALSSPSQDSDEDSDREEMHLDDDVDETLHDQHSERPRRKAKRRKWNRDIPFSKSYRTKNLSQHSLSKTSHSHSYPVTSLRREDAASFTSHRSSSLTTYSAVPRPSQIPKFTLSNLRSNIHSTTNSFSLTHRLSLPHRLAYRSSPVESTPSSTSSSISSASPSTPLPSAFRSCFKPGQEGETGRTKKQVLLKLENDVIVQPSSSYEELPGINSSAIFSPRSPPLHDDDLLAMSSKPKTEVSSDSDSAKNDSPPASLLVEVNTPPGQPSTFHEFTPRRPVKVGDSPSTDVSKNTGDEPDDNKEEDTRKFPPHFNAPPDIQVKHENPLLRSAPKEVPYEARARGGAAKGLGLNPGEKRGSSSSLASETPALKHSKSSFSSTTNEGVFFFDEDIDRYQGPGPDDNHEVCLCQYSHSLLESPLCVRMLIVRIGRVDDESPPEGGILRFKGQSGNHSQELRFYSYQVFPSFPPGEYVDKS